MSEMTTQEMIDWLHEQASKCHAAQGVPDLAARFEAIAARLKALEERGALLMDAVVKAQRGLASAECQSWYQGGCAECDVCVAQFVVRAAILDAAREGEK